MGCALLGVLALAACGTDGGPTPAPPGSVRTLAYVSNWCREDPDGTAVLRQALRIQQGEGDPVTVVEYAVGPIAAKGLCRGYGERRSGTSIVIGGGFQRLGVNRDASVVVFEVTDRFSLLGVDFVPRDQEGIYIVRPDGGGVRRVGPASRAPSFAYTDLSPGRLDFDYYAVLAFSPNGRTIVYPDLGPGVRGRARQIFSVDLVTGERMQLTHLPPSQGGLGTDWAFFLTPDTVVFASNVESPVPTVIFQDNFTVAAKPTPGIEPEKVRVVAVGGGGFVPVYEITGAEPEGRTVQLPNAGPPVNGPAAPSGQWAGVINEAFLLDGKRVLQLTNFRRWDTLSPRLMPDRKHVLFVASADPLGTNPSESCQFFSIDRLGRDLRQLTHFREGDPSPYGCIEWGPPPGCTIDSTFRQNPQTGAIVFGSTCDPFGTNPYGEQIFAMNPDGTGLRQLTHAAGLVEAADGTITVELPGPWAAPVRTR